MTLSHSENETQDIAKEVSKKIASGGLVCLFGDLGTGKTTFTKGLAENLGIEKFTVKSPTYTYMRDHKLKNGHKLYHIDLYRLNGVDELLLEEIQEIINNPHNLVVIEWADRLDEYLPKERINIIFKYISDTEREITVQ